MSFLPFRCLAVPPPGFPAALLSATGTALTAAVGMAPEAAAADQEGGPAEAAMKLDEKHMTFRSLQTAGGHGTT